MTTIIVLAIYTVLVLVFVPLDKIAAAQKSVKTNVQKLIDKINK